MSTGSRSTTLARSDTLALRRVHVQAPYWGISPGTDYWLMPDAKGTTASIPGTLADWGWTTTSLVATVGSGADLNAPVDYGTPANWSSDASADALASPMIFGDYAHSHAAMVLAGQRSMPRYVICDIFGALSTNSANEPLSGFGFSRSTVGTEANHVAFINTDGTSFLIENQTTLSTAGPAVDTAYHNFRIILDGYGIGKLSATGAAAGGGQKIRWSVDGVAQPTLTLAGDQYPCTFEAYANTTNRFNLASVHIFYAWNIDSDPGLI